MQFSSRLSTAVHILLYLAEYEQEEKVTSEVLADTTGVNAVNIRKILGLLKKSDLIETRFGVGGTYLKKKQADITLGMIFRAVETEEASLFRMHGQPNTNCPVGRSIQGVLDRRISQISEVMLAEMDGIRLCEMYEDMKKKIGEAEE